MSTVTAVDPHVSRPLSISCLIQPSPPAIPLIFPHPHNRSSAPCLFQSHSKACLANRNFNNTQWLADLGAVFYSIKEKGWSAREKRVVTETEFNRKMEIEAQMAEDHQRMLRQQQHDGQDAAQGSGAEGGVRGRKGIAEGAGAPAGGVSRGVIRPKATGGIISSSSSNRDGDGSGGRGAAASPSGGSRTIASSAVKKPGLILGQRRKRGF